MYLSLSLAGDELHVGAAGAGERLDGEYLVVEVSVGEPVLGPVVEVGLHVDGSGGSLVLSHREELREGCRAHDGRLVVLRVGADLVARPVAAQRAQLSDAGPSARVELDRLSG